MGWAQGMLYNVPSLPRNGKEVKTMGIVPKPREPDQTGGKPHPKPQPVPKPR
jgi:hypothetical protein